MGFQLRKFADRVEPEGKNALWSESKVDKLTEGRKQKI